LFAAGLRPTRPPPRMSRLAQTFNHLWLGRGVLARLLWPLSCLMGLLVWLRRRAFHKGQIASVRLPVPVIVVGNRVVGGAGKTPTTIALLEHLKARGWRPGVLSRGYKSKGTNGLPTLIDAASAAHVSAQSTGDEPLLIWRRTQVPVMVGRDRATGGRALLAAHPDINVLVCDDGLQHLRLQRDIEVIVFDERGAGNGWLVPAGPLREPVHAAAPPQLKAPPIVIYNAPAASTDLPGHLARRHMAPLCPLDDWWRGRLPSRSFEPQGALASQSVWAVAGIAHPQRFFDALTREGLAFQAVPLDDHADFSALPWPASATDVIVTEKDAVKLQPARMEAERPGCQIWVAALDLRPDASFWTAVDTALACLPLSLSHRPHGDGLLPSPLDTKPDDGHSTH
jgi:tetraacyldisaccharide 4'-kinase